MLNPLDEYNDDATFTTLRETMPPKTPLQINFEMIKFGDKDSKSSLGGLVHRLI